MEFFKVKFIQQAITFCALFIISATNVQAQEMKTMPDENPAYALIQVEIANKNEFFTSYTNLAAPSIHEHGGRVLVATENKNIKEGEWSSNWSVVLKFPSMMAANNWYSSEKYQKAIPYRLNSVTYTNMVFMDGYIYQ